MSRQHPLHRTISRAAVALTASSAIALLAACDDAATAPRPLPSAARATGGALADTTLPILFAHRIDTGPWQIFSQRRDRTELTQLTSGMEHFDPTRTYAYAQVKKIAYVERLSATQSRIVVADPDGTNPVAVTPWVHDAHKPSFSPDGKKLVFSVGIPRPGGTSYHQAIFMAGTTPGSMARLPLYDDNDDTYPTWKHENQVAYIGGKPGMRIIYGIAPTGGTPIPMIADFASKSDITSFGVSGDGRTVVFTREGGTSIFAYGDVKNGTIVGKGGIGETFADPSFSPDSKMIVFTDRTTGGGSKLMSARTDGTGGLFFLNPPDGHNDGATAWVR
jgi:hypothetical protein